jgi:Restriction endonuclease NotI
MQLDFAEMSHSKNDRLPFPTTIRRPDYRSSGPKRLMPQLQVKVPTLSRWGKKMAVVVDEDFFKNLGDIPPVNHLSNAEVVWFIITYIEQGTSIKLRPSRRVLTTLDASVRGLIAAEALPQDKFEDMITSKAERLSR